LVSRVKWATEFEVIRPFDQAPFRTSESRWDFCGLER
jgi:hypothetical protein